MKKIFIITNEISRRGGIEEVTRQVNRIYESSPGYKVELIIYPKNRISEVIFKFKLFFIANRDCVIMFMHPFILNRFSKLWLFFVKSKLICWAYGIDVWGNFGKARTIKFNNIDLIIAISEFTKNQIINNYPSVNVKVVNLGVDESLINKIDNARTDTFEILTVGRLSSDEKYKGHDLVIQALINLKNKGLDQIIYHIVGSGNDIERLRTMVIENNLTDKVIFHGYIPDTNIHEIYNRCSVFVMPSQVIKRDNLIWGGEGFGLVYLEAGLYNLPVIATKEGGQIDCIVDGKTGFLINYNVLDLEAKITLLYNNKDMVNEMGKCAREFILNNFTLNHFKSRLLEIV